MQGESLWNRYMDCILSKQTHNHFRAHYVLTVLTSHASVATPDLEKKESFHNYTEEKVGYQATN